MAIQLDDEIMNAIQTEVQSAVAKMWAERFIDPIVQDIKSLREDFKSFQMSACGLSDLSFHLDGMKKDLLERIDNVQEQCDVDLMRNQRAVKQLKGIAKHVHEPNALVNTNINHPALVDEIDQRIEELRTNMLAALANAVKEVSDTTHQRIDKLKQCMDRSLKVIRDRLDQEPAKNVVAACSQLQQMHASMQKQLNEIEEEQCLWREASMGKLGSIIKSGGSPLSVHM